MGTAAASQRWELSEGDRPGRDADSVTAAPCITPRASRPSALIKRRSPSSWRSLPAISWPATSPTSA